MLSILLEVLRLRESLRWLMTIPRRASFVIKFKIDLLVTPPPWLHRQGGYAKKPPYFERSCSLISNYCRGGGTVHVIWTLTSSIYDSYISIILYITSKTLCMNMPLTFVTFFVIYVFCIWHIFYKSSCLW